jgi:hypothetical protein
MNEIRIYSFIVIVISLIWGPNLRPTPLTFKKYKMNLVVNVSIWNSPPKSNLELILIGIKKV